MFDDSNSLFREHRTGDIPGKFVGFNKGFSSSHTSSSLKMASLCRSAAAKIGSSSIAALRSKTLIPKPFPSSTRSTPCALRIAVALASVESLMPLHSAIASARLKSIIAVDSSCWSWLSQDFAVPR